MRLGEYQELEYIKKVDFGIYLAESQRAEERVLLPAKQVPQGLKLGDKIKVFLYWLRHQIHQAESFRTGL